MVFILVRIFFLLIYRPNYNSLSLSIRVIFFLEMTLFLIVCESLSIHVRVFYFLRILVVYHFANLKSLQDRTLTKMAKGQ